MQAHANTEVQQSQVERAEKLAQQYVAPPPFVNSDVIVNNTLC
jgi:hypothetical protein